MSLKHLGLQFTKDKNSLSLTEHSKLECEQKRTLYGHHTLTELIHFKKSEKNSYITFKTSFVRFNMMMNIRIA